MSDARLTAEAMEGLDSRISNEKEAHELLALIDAEFQSDPMSVQCFDLRVVARVKECVALRKTLKSRWPWI